MRAKIYGGLALAFLLASGATGEPLFVEGATWRYYKGRTSTPPNNANGRNWTQETYDDSTGWGGPSPSGFGYGDADDATIFSDMQQISGTQDGYFSVFIRRTFTMANPGSVTRLTLAVDYDDGFVAYVNGTEVARRNMPAGAISYNTAASGIHEASRGNGGSNPHEKEFIEINPALLVAGNNVLAISGHNVSLISSDFTLVPELYSNVTLVRGPFLQMPSAGAISIVWRTDALTDSAIDYGTDINYTGGTVTDSALLRQHFVTLPVLPQGTTIFYRVRSGGVTLAESSFKTPPNSTQPYRFAVYGDFGWSDPQTSAVAARVNATNPDFTVTVGDNIYQDGQPGSYDPYWFIPYDAINRRAPLFPAMGNHDIDNSSNGQYYIDNFYLPQNGPAGLLERNYSFDYGNAHFAVIEVNPFVYTINAAQQTAIKSWLASDLAGSTQRWKFVIFHQPAYTSSGSGVHSPETILQTDIQPICAQNGVQMIFQGHNHFYERINPINAVNYITSGGGGRSLTSPSVFPTYSAVVNASVYSFTQIDINGGQLTLRQIDQNGSQIDLFEMNLDHPFKIDGLLDSADYQRAVNGLKLHAAIRGNFLYVATQDAGEGSDHFIYLNNQSAAMRAANWSKAGEVMTWSAFLADENDSGFKGWFNASEQLLTNNAVYKATTSGLNNNDAAANGVLEGTIDLAAHFGTFPSQIHLAAAPFATANNDALVNSAQVPAGNLNGDIEANEFLVLNTRDIALDLPVSNAGPDQTVEAGMQVTLSGNGSNAPSGLPLSYAWSELTGPTGSITNANQPVASFVSSANVTQNTDLVFRLRVNDTRFDTDDTVTIQLFPMVDSDSDGLSDQEELTGQNNGLTTADPAGSTTNPNLADSDGDGMSDGNEALAETNPNDAASVFRVSTVEKDGSGFRVYWSSEDGQVYRLQRKTDLSQEWEDIGINIPAAGSISSALDAAPGVGPNYYRVRLAN